MRRDRGAEGPWAAQVLFAAAGDEQWLLRNVMHCKNGLHFSDGKIYSKPSVTLETGGVGGL